ncbi:MAG: flagellar hook-associated protein FlgK, partial [Mariprofundales bacterium]
MSLTSALNIGASSLTTQQRAMDVLANNIANVNTPGYSRQRPDLSTQVPESGGGFSFGRGTQLASVVRQVDLTLQKSLSNSGSQKAMWTQVSQGLNAIENVFGSLSATGLAASFDNFFASWQQLANNPQDSAQKVNVGISSGEMVTSLTNMHTQLRTEQFNVNTQIDQKLTDANLLLTQIASLNTQILRQETGQSTGGQANDLRDKREQALQDLSLLIPVQRVDNPDGSSLVQTPGGDLLVQDDVAHQFTRGISVDANGFQNIVLNSSPLVSISGMGSGGTVGGMLDLRDNRYGSYISKLDSIAKNMIFGVNQVYSNGSSPIRGSVVTAGQPSVVSSIARGSTITAAQTSVSAPRTLANSGIAGADQMKTGSFQIYVYDSAGKQINTTGLSISIAPSLTVLDDSASHGGTATTASVVGLINKAVTDYNTANPLPATQLSFAASTTNGVLKLDAGASGQSLGLSKDTTNFLDTFGLKSFLLDSSGVPFANQIKSGSFKIHLYDSAGKVLNTGGLSIAIDPSATMLDDSAFSTPPATTNVVLGSGISTVGGTRYSGSALPVGSFVVGDVLTGSLINAASSTAAITFPIGTLSDGTNSNLVAVTLAKDGATTLGAAIAATGGVGINAAAASYTIANGGTPPLTTGVVVGAGTVTLTGPVYPAASLPTGSFATGDILTGSVISGTSSVAAITFPAGTLSDGTNTNLVPVTLPKDGVTTLGAAIAATAGSGMSSTVTNYTVSNGGTPPATTGVVLTAGVSIVSGTRYTGNTLPTGNFVTGDAFTGSFTNASSSAGALTFPAGTLSDGTSSNLVAVTLPNDGSTSLSAAIAATVGVGMNASASSYTIAHGGTPPVTTGVVVGAGSVTFAKTTYPVVSLPTGNFSVGDTLSDTVTNATASAGSIVFPPGTLSDGTTANLVAVTLPNDGVTTLRSAIVATTGVGNISTQAGATYFVESSGSSSSVVGLINQAVRAYNHPKSPTVAPTVPLLLTAST